MTDIVGRLRAACTDWDGTALPPASEPMDGLHCDVLIDAATEIERLRRELAEARETLAPFAKLGAHFLDPDNQTTKGDGWPVWGYNAADLTYGDFRRAFRALAHQGREG